MKFILGQKREMTQRYREDGRVVPVTAVQAGPCVVTQVKSGDQDGYQAVQVGFGFKKKLNKPSSGHLAKLENSRHLSEFRNPEVKLERGDKIDVSIFAVGDQVKVTGVSKGKGFQGVVKRHGFHGSPASHGHKDQLRMPGSIGATDAARVFKGTRMGGRMGAEQVTVKNLEIIEVDQDNNLLFIKGAIPGPRGGFVKIIGEGTFEPQLKADTPLAQVKEETKEEPKAEEKTEVVEEIVKEEKAEVKAEVAKVEEEKSESRVKVSAAAEDLKVEKVKEELKTRAKPEAEAK